MIGLIAAARPGGGGRPTYYTVPWCPQIESHRMPEMPGIVWKHVRRVVDLWQEKGLSLADLRRVNQGDLLFALALGAVRDPLGILIFEGARRLILELEMIPAEGS